MLEYFEDAFNDSIRLIPFLLIIYFIMEFIEHKTGDGFKDSIKKADKLGPLIGGILGVVPQCGLSASAASLFSGKVITAGTLLAVFLSASDEMLPILISESVSPLVIVKIISFKAIIGIISGYILDLIWKKIVGIKNRQNAKSNILNEDSMVDNSDIKSHCLGHKNIFLGAIMHTLEIFIYIFLFSFAINCIIGFIGEDTLSDLFSSVPVVGELIAGLIGLIPNCASSVIITELYLEGVIHVGALFAGLLVNAGVGTLVLIRTNNNKKESLIFILSLYTMGIIWGIIIQLLNITFI